MYCFVLTCVVVTVALGVGVFRLAPRLLHEEFSSREDWMEAARTGIIYLAPCFSNNLFFPLLKPFFPMYMFYLDHF